MGLSDATLLKDVRSVMTQMTSRQKELEVLRAGSESIHDSTSTITQSMGNLKGPTTGGPWSRDRHDDVEESKPPGPRRATLLILQVKGLVPKTSPRPRLRSSIGILAELLKNAGEGAMESTLYKKKGCEIQMLPGTEPGILRDEFNRIWRRRLEFPVHAGFDEDLEALDVCGVLAIRFH